MLIVTNYPNVPIATSNVATDAVRVENQQKPPVIPPTEATKGHEERSFNPQNERSADSPDKSTNQARLLEKQQQQAQARVQGDVQREQQRQQEQQPERKAAAQVSQLAEQLLPKSLKLAPQSQGALQRKDIKLRTPQDPKAASAPSSVLRQAPVDQAPQFYRQLGQRIDSFYQQQAQPETDADISVRI